MISISLPTASSAPSGRIMLGLGAAGLAVLGGCTGALRTEPSHEKPNIVVIMADDMGYSDIGCYGGEIPTPNLDALAENGIRFTQFYNGGRCCPTRASLLTGLYAHQAGVGAMVSSNEEGPGYLGRLNESCATFAEVLRLQGYQTFMSGKWHVTHYDYGDPEPTLHPGSWPLQRGFDRFFGTLAGAGSFYDPVSLMEGNDFIAPWDDFYYTEAITDKAMQFVEEANRDRPFLLYVSHTAPHWPMHAREEHIRLFEEKYFVGWDRLREQRYARMQEMGLVDAQWQLSARDEEVPTWEETPDKDWEAHRMAVYAAMVYSMDLGIGKIVETLKRQGLFENTLIVFLSDNGACAEVIQGTETRHGYFARGGTRPDILPGGPDTYATYGRAWANAGNTPFRKFKRWMHEGGIATPLIAHWPAVIHPGQVTDHVGHIIDLMPTFVEATGGQYPDTLSGRTLLPPEGISILPLLQGREEDQALHESLFWEHLGYYAMRQDKWKLVAAGGAWELYDLENDRTEQHNLAAAFPEKLAAMEEQWLAWARRAQVLKETGE